LVRDVPHYRRDAILAGLKAIGFHVGCQTLRPQPGDVLVTWNRYAHYESMAQAFERVGAAVIVAENGYLGATENAYAKPYAASGDQLYTLSLGHHNGAGRWWVGHRGRWREQGISVKPWREDGEHILVLPQRGIGPDGVAMPPDWPERTLAWLRTMTIRPVRVRSHPGNEPAKKPLEADLEGCWCAVTWGSGAALKAMCAGVPAYSDFDRWIGFPGALPLSQIGRADPVRSHDGRQFDRDHAREVMLDRISWAQHEVAEIATGEPLRRLIDMHIATARAAA
jgi:hypothetical protein